MVLYIHQINKQIDSRKTERETIKMAETMVNGMKFKVWNDTTRRATFAESEDGRVEKIHDCGYITADLTIRKAIAMVYNLPTFRKNAVKTTKVVEETPVAESKEQEVETVEQTEIETEEMAESKYIAEEYRNYFITGNERIGIVALDTHGHYCDKVFKTLEDAKRAVDEDIEYAEKKYAEQEAETETTAVETSEQTEETKDENTHIWVTKEAYFYLRNQMRKQRGFKPLTKKQKERILIHITKNGMSNKIRLDHNSLGGGDGTKDGRWWGWNVVTLKKLLKKAGYSYET